MHPKKRNACQQYFCCGINTNGYKPTKSRIQAETNHYYEQLFIFVICSSLHLRKVRINYLLDFDVFQTLEREWSIRLHGCDALQPIHNCKSSFIFLPTFIYQYDFVLSLALNSLNGIHGLTMRVTRNTKLYIHGFIRHSFLLALFNHFRVNDSLPGCHFMFSCFWKTRTIFRVFMDIYERVMLVYCTAICLTSSPPHLMAGW